MIRIIEKKKGERYANGRKVKKDFKHISVKIDDIDVFRGEYKVSQKQEKVFYENILFNNGYRNKTNIRKNDKSYGNLCFHLYQENNEIIQFNLNSIQATAKAMNVNPSSLIKPKQKIYELDISFKYGHKVDHMMSEIHEGLFMNIMIETFTVQSALCNQIKTIESDESLSYNRCFADLNGLLNINESEYYSEYDYSYSHNDENVDLSILENLKGLFA